MRTIRSIYDRTFRTILERGGTRLGLLSEAQFLEYYTATIQDFLQSTGMIRKLHVQIADLGTMRYELPEWAMSVDQVAYDEEFLWRTTLDSLQSGRPEYLTSNQSPDSWRSDNMEMDEYEIAPAPKIQGPEVEVDPITGGYGTLREPSSSAGDITIDTEDQGYGIVRGDGYGSMYFEADGPAFGVIRGMVLSEGNITSVVKANIFKREDLSLDDPVELVPDCMVTYLCHGVLARVFESDGELLDKFRAKYFATRYQEGKNLVAAILKDEALAEEA